MPLVGWCFWDQRTEGKCRLGYVIGLMSSTLTGPCHVFRWTSKFFGGTAKSSLGGEVHALSDMVHHTSLLRDFYGSFEGLDPGTMASEDCESHFTHLKTKKVIAEENSARHFLRILRALEKGGLDNTYWAPGAENPADGLTNVRRDTVPRLRLLESGPFNPGSLRPLKGAAFRERAYQGRHEN